MPPVTAARRPRNIGHLVYASHVDAVNLLLKNGTVRLTAPARAVHWIDLAACRLEDVTVETGTVLEDACVTDCGFAGVQLSGWVTRDGGIRYHVSLYLDVRTYAVAAELI